jgi:hypothetical protein
VVAALGSCEASDGDAVAAKAVGYQVAEGISPWRQEWFGSPSGRMYPVDDGWEFAIGPDSSGELRHVPLSDDELGAVLHQQAALFLVDDGQVFPRSHGIWRHNGSGPECLATELLSGRRPENDHDVVALLTTLADLAERGVCDAHGDIKQEHVFIEPNGRVRLCDPSVRLPSGVRQVTPLYNPFAWSGPAADAVACAWMMRYRFKQPNHGWEWAREIADGGAVAPGWANDHLAARDRLLHYLARPAQPLPPGFSIPEKPDQDLHHLILPARLRDWSSGPASWTVRSDFHRTMPVWSHNSDQTDRPANTGP